MTQNTESKLQDTRDQSFYIRVFSDILSDHIMCQMKNMSLSQTVNFIPS